MCTKSTVPKTMATDTFTHNSKRTKTLKQAHKNAKESSKNFKPCIHNVVSIGTNFAKKYGFLIGYCLF